MLRIPFEPLADRRAHSALPAVDRSSPTTSAAAPSSSMRSVSGRPSPAAPSRQCRWESSACPPKYVAQVSISRRGGRWPLRPDEAAEDDSDEVVYRHAHRRRVRPRPLAGVGAFLKGYIRTGATPPSRAAPAAKKGGGRSRPLPLRWRGSGRLV